MKTSIFKRAKRTFPLLNEGPKRYFPLKRKEKKNNQGLGQRGPVV